MSYLKGQAVNMRLRDLMSRNVEDEETIGFGVPVFQGENDYGVTTDGDNFVGVTVHEFNLEEGFPQYSEARIASTGIIAVEVSEDVEAGDQVAHDGANGTFSTSAGTGIHNSRFEKSGSEGDIVPASFNGNATTGGE